MSVLIADFSAVIFRPQKGEGEGERIGHRASPAIVSKQNHSPDPGDCCARSIVSHAAGTIRDASVQQKNPALRRGFSGYRVVYFFWVTCATALGSHENSEDFPSVTGIPISNENSCCPPYYFLCIAFLGENIGETPHGGGAISVASEPPSHAFAEPPYCFHRWA